MNNCLADLSRLIPADYMKKGRGRIEKTEIIEMAIKHMKHLQDHHTTCPLGELLITLVLYLCRDAVRDWTYQDLIHKPLKLK